MTNAIIIHTADQGSAVSIVPTGATKDQLSRLSAFDRWLADSGLNWTQPNLADYSQHLQHGRGLSPASTNAHLSTIRGRYKAILADNATRRALYTHAAAAGAKTATDAKAMVDEILTQINNAIGDKAAAATVTKHQDIADDKHTRLTVKQANALIAAPGTSTLVGLRDTALIALALATGLREMELCGLDVSDLRCEFGGALALSVRMGKGAKSRLIPYGAMGGCLAAVDAWLTAAGITSGAVFRAFYKGSKRTRPTRLSVRAVQDILNKYPVKSGKGEIMVNPHDLRRTYARRLFDSGMDIVAIQQNLGHADVKTTLGYIGILDSDQRQPGAVFAFEFDDLDLWQAGA